MTPGEKLKKIELRIHDIRHYGIKGNMKRIDVQIEKKSRRSVKLTITNQVQHQEDRYIIMDITQTVKKMKRSFGKINKDTTLQITFPTMRRNRLKSKRLAEDNDSVLVVYSQDKNFLKRFSNSLAKSHTS